MSDLVRLRSGQGVADSAGATDLARRLASLQVGQQLAAQQQQAQAQLQQQAQAHSDQNAVLMQLLTTLLAQKVGRLAGVLSHDHVAHWLANPACSMHSCLAPACSRIQASSRCLLTSGCCMQRQEAAAQQQQMPQQLPPGLEGQVPSTEALAALYQQLSGGGGPQALPMTDMGYGQQVGT